MARFYRCLATVVLMNAGLFVPAHAQFMNGQAAVGVLGQPDFISKASGVSASAFNGPNGLAIDPTTGKLFVVDRANHRILRWSSSAALSNGSAAEAVLGQLDFTSNSSGLAANKFNNPIGIYVDAGGRLWVGDFSNNRVLRFDGASTKANGANADAVLGQPDFITGSSGTTAAKMNGPVGLYLDNTGRLWVSNFGAHRVLRFNDAANKANGADADGVLGQPDLVTGTSGLTQSKMNNPNSVYVDEQGRLWVSEFTNRRITRFDDAANKANGANADGVLGQPDFVTNVSNTTRNGFGNVRFVTGDPSGRIYAVQEPNNRITIFNDAANKPNGADADFVLGQPDFVTGTAPNPPTASSLNTPRAMTVDYLFGRLWVADWGNNRVLRYDLARGGTASLTLNAPNGGETWVIGSQQNILWSSQNVGQLNLEYSIDNGATWIAIANLIPAVAGKYLWTIPNTPTAQARVRITDAANSALRDASDAPFNISSLARVIVVLGSSTAAGTGASTPDSSWVGRYTKYILGLDNTAKVINLAVGGFTTYDVMPTGYVPPAGRPTPKANNNITHALTFKPTAIIINLPSNDATNGYSISEQLANYDTVLARARSPKVPVWVATTQPRNLSVAQRQNLMAMRDSTFARFGSKAIDFWNGLANADGTIQSQFDIGDGIHLNNAGHRLLFQRVVGARIWEVLTDVKESFDGLPRDFSLSQNFPNPFNPETTIAYELPFAAQVELQIYDVLGRKVVVLYSGPQVAGRHSLHWNAGRQSGGLYLYRIIAQAHGRTVYTQVKKLLLVK